MAKFHSWEYQNAARAGRTHHGKIERRARTDASFQVEVRPGYRVKANARRQENRSDRRSRGMYVGVSTSDVPRRMVRSRARVTVRGWL